MELTNELGVQLGRDGLLLFMVIKMLLDHLKDREKSSQKESNTDVNLNQAVRALADNSIRQTTILEGLSTTISRVEGRLEAKGDCKFVPKNGALGHY